MLAAIGDDAAVRLYDMNPEGPAASARTLAGHTKPLMDLAFSLDGHWLATASEDGTVRLWDLSVPDQIALKRTLSQPNQVVWTLAFSPDGRWLATGGEPGGVRLWDLRDPSAEPKALRDSYGHNRKVAFSPDSNWLVAGATESYQALLFHAPFDGPPLSFHVDQWITNVTFSPDKRWLVVPDHYDAFVLDLSKADPTSEPMILRGQKDFIRDMAFSPDGTWLATGSTDHIVRLWNAADRFSGPHVFAGHEGPISGLAFSHDNRWLATASEDKTVRLWDVGSPLAEPVSLRSASDPTKLRMWNLRQGARLEVPQAWGDDLGAGAGTAFSPDGKWLAAFSNPIHAVTLRNLTTSPHLEFRLDHPGFASPVFSPDGRWLATGGLDTMVKLWDLTSPDPGARPTILPGHSGFIRSLAFSANSHWLVSGAQETIARVWDLTASDPAAKPKALPGGGGTSIIRTVAISPNGRYVLTGSWEPDYAARIWDMSLPDPASNPIKLSFNDRVFGSAFSADGRWAAAIGWDYAIQLFNLNEARRQAVRPAGGRAGSFAGVQPR
jgi:WD40 repeat protein